MTNTVQRLSAATVDGPEPAIGAVRAQPGSIATRIARGVGALSFAAAITTFGQLTIVPVALSTWGEVRYGEWVLLAGLVSLLRLTDLGLQTFVVNRMNEAYAHGRPDELRLVLGSALRVLWPIVGTVLVLLSAAAFLLPLSSLLGLRTIEGFELSVVILLLGLEFLLGAPLGVIGGVYRAIGRLPRSAMFNAFQQVALVASMLALIALRVDFIVLASARTAIAVILTIWVLHDLRQWFPWLRLWPDCGSWRLGVQMIGPGLFFLLIPLADYVSTQVGLTVVQRSLDGGEVSRLVTHRTTVNVAQMASGILMTACWPELTTLRAAGRTADLLRAHQSLARANLWLVGALGLGMLPFVAWIYPSWTAGRLQFDGWTFVLLMTRLLIWAVWSTSMTVLLATNRHRRVAVALLIAALLNAGLSTLLVPGFGIRGAALAALAGDVAVSAWFIPLALMRDLGGNIWLFFRVVIYAGVVCVALPGGLAVVLWQFVPISAIRFGVIFPLTASLALVLIWSQLAAYEREQLVRPVRRTVDRLTRRP